MSPDARRYASIAMVVLGPALVLVGGFALYEQIPRSPATASQVNAFGVLNGPVAVCAAQRGLQPNIVAVDFYERGDLLEVARVQNGLDRNALPSYRRTDAG